MDDDVIAVFYARGVVENATDDGLTAEEQAAVSRLFSGAADGGRAVETCADELAHWIGAGPVAGRRAAAQALAAMGAVAVPALVHALDDPPRRLIAAGALGTIRDTRAVPRLLEMLRSGAPPERAAAASALGEIRDPVALEALVHAGRDPEVEVRDAALAALDLMRSALAMLGTAALIERRAGTAGTQTDGRSGADAERAELPRPAPPERTLLERLLGL